MIMVDLIRRRSVTKRLESQPLLDSAIQDLRFGSIKIRLVPRGCELKLYPRYLAKPPPANRATRLYEQIVEVYDWIAEQTV